MPSKPKTPFLAVYDGGMSGVWVIIDAREASEIACRYPELQVVPRPAWMTDVLYANIERTSHYDIDVPNGWLGQMVDHRTPPAIERAVYKSGGPWPSLFVSVQGEWSPGRPAFWRGRATAPEPFVFAVVTAAGGAISWRKSDHSGCTVVPLSIEYHWEGPAEGDLRVCFSVGSVAVRCVTSNALQREGPPLHHATQVMDGLLCELTRVVGSPRLEFCVVFLARAAIELGADGSWIVPSPNDPATSKQLLTVLRGGRAGSL